MQIWMMCRSYLVPTVPPGGVLEVIDNAAAAVTLIGSEPVMELVTVSVAVIVCVPLPTVSSAAEKVPVPLVRVESAGSFAWLSVLVKCTVPVYPTEVLFAASNALTVSGNVFRVWVALGPVTPMCVAAFVTTLIGLDVPFSEAVTVSLAVIVCMPSVLSVDWKLPVPLVSIEFAGNVACASLLVKCTVPV